MKWLAAAGAVFLIAITAPNAAQAREGCGGGFHRGYRGACRANVHHRVRQPHYYHRHGGDLAAERFTRHGHFRRHRDWSYRPLHPQ